MGKYGLVVVLVALTLLTGCRGPMACTAIGWLNHLSVELEGDASRVEIVQVCVEDVCSAPAEPVRRELEDQSAAPGAARPADPNGSTPPEVSPYSVTRVKSDSWTVDVGMSTPEEVTVRALDDDGGVLAEEAFALDWVRVGGSELCGGPAEAAPVTLVLP